MHLQLLLFALCVALTRGQAPPDYDALQAELDANVAKWETSGGSDYTMVISRQCFCLVEALGPFTVTVVDDAIVAVEPDNEFSDGLPTVDGVFTMIQDAINDKVDGLTVSYDAELGYPTNVFIDRSFLIADEEMGYEISVELDDGEQPEPVCDPDLISDRLPVVAPLGKAKGNGFSVSEYLAAISRWRDYLESVNCAYKYKLTRSCFCVPDFVGPFIITVENGVVTDAEFEDPSGLPDVPVPTDLPTITELFGIILVEAKDADMVTYVYDDKTGVPTSAFIDRIELAADDEITYLAELL